MTTQKAKEKGTERLTLTVDVEVLEVPTINGVPPKDDLCIKKVVLTTRTILPIVIFRKRFIVAVI